MTDTRVEPYIKAQVGDWVYKDEIPDLKLARYPECLIYQGGMFSLVYEDNAGRVFNTGELAMVFDAAGNEVKSMLRRVR